MKLTIFFIIFILLLGCQSTSITNFKLVAIPKSGVNPVAARKIVLTMAIDSKHQEGGIVREIYPISEEERLECFQNKNMYDTFKEFCGSQYFVNSIYRPGVGYSSYRALEVCSETVCNYKISNVYEGLEE